jgi:hypothetical protein
MAKSSRALESRSTVWKAAGAYFSIVFGTGFVLGTVRVPFLVPAIGERYAELAEMPVMLAAIVLTARFVLRRFRGVTSALHWAVVGALALTLLLAAELLLAVVLSGRSLAAYIAAKDPVSGPVYLVMLLVFAAMPWLLYKSKPSAASDNGA